jgi:hypothetical protein
MKKEIRMKITPFAGVFIDCDGKIIIPPGSKRFAAVRYIGNYPVVWSKIAGVTFKNHKEVIQEYTKTLSRELDEVDQEIFLVPEPDNKFDPNAIKVMAQIINRKRPVPDFRGCIGYLPKELAFLLTRIKETFNITYEAALDNIKSNIDKNGKEKNYSCSAAVVLTPNTIGNIIPLQGVIKISNEFVSLKNFKKEILGTIKKRKAQ